MNVDFGAKRLHTRRQQGLDDDLPLNIVDALVQLTRSSFGSGPDLHRGIAAAASPTGEIKIGDDEGRQSEVAS